MPVLGSLGCFRTGPCCWLTVFSGTQTYGGAGLLHHAFAFLSKALFPAEGTTESKRSSWSLSVLCTPYRAHVVSPSSLTMSVWVSVGDCVCVGVWTCMCKYRFVCMSLLKQGGQCNCGRRALNCVLHHFLCSHFAAVAGLHFLPLPSAEWSLFIVTRTFTPLRLEPPLCALTCWTELSESCGTAVNSHKSFFLKSPIEKLCLPFEQHKRLSNSIILDSHIQDLWHWVESYIKSYLFSGVIFSFFPFSFHLLPPTHLQLPDGRVIKVGGERFEAPEALFQPHLINVEGVGVAELLFNTIQAADIDTRWG